MYKLNYKKFAGKDVSVDEFLKENKRGRGKRARQKGGINRRKSIAWILSHPEKYGIAERIRIQTSQEGQFGGDLFDLWDLMTMPKLHNPYSDSFGIGIIPLTPETASKTEFKHIYLFQVKTNQMPDNKYTKQLIDFQVPFYVKKELHIWEDGKSVPVIIPL